MESNPKAASSRRRFRLLLGLTAGLTIANLFLSASLVGLLGGLLILGMIWGIFRGDYSLTKALRVVLILFGIVNLAILAAVLISGAEARISAMLWLGGYSAAILFLGVMLGSRVIQTYIATAPPEKKESRFHFFHGGWRDL